MCTDPESEVKALPGGVIPRWNLNDPFEYTVNCHVTVFHVVVDSPVTLISCIPVQVAPLFTFRTVEVTVPALNWQVKYTVAPAWRDVYPL